MLVCERKSKIWRMIEVELSSATRTDETVHENGWNRPRKQMFVLIYN